MSATGQWHRRNGNRLELHVAARTRCREEGIAGVSGDALRVRVNAPPVEGRANKRLLAVLAQAFGVPPSRVRLIHGARSRRKRVDIEQPRRIPDDLRSVLCKPDQVEKRRKAV